MGILGLLAVRRLLTVRLGWSALAVRCLLSWIRLLCVGRLLLIGLLPVGCRLTILRLTAIGRLLPISGLALARISLLRLLVVFLGEEAHIVEIIGIRDAWKSKKWGVWLVGSECPLSRAFALALL